MKASRISSLEGKLAHLTIASKICVAVALAALVGVSLNMTICQAQQPDSNAAGEEVLTRGPVHEAFAGIVTFNPEPGVVVAKAPPEVIEEVPPEERPEGDNISWIPGYWAWDDERSDYLWVSGTWRALPPGREWFAGYWGKTAQGYQWTSGYWADATAKETTYLPAPPATVEVGPNIAAPSVDYGWSPGCWIWYQGRYAWRPGYWVLGRADWDWCPGHYVWTPRGYIFVGGFWDYPVERRGILFAPVYFGSGVYSRRGYHYSPTIVIDLGVFSDHLFLRPRYSHYYFGDYYAASYFQGGFYASFSFQSGRYGYDPIYSQQRWEHRQDREWEHRAAASFVYRRDHETARPPRTWVAQQHISPDSAESKQNRAHIATPFDQLAKRKDGAMRFQPVAKEERQKLAQRGQEVQQSRDQRRTLEASPVDTKARKPSAAFEPVKVKLPRSPIVAKSGNQLGKNQSPPKAQQAPKPDLKFQPKPEAPARQPGVERNNPQPAPRKAEPEKTSAPERIEAAPRERKAQPAQPNPQPRVQESGTKVQEPSQRGETDAGRAKQIEAQQQAKEATAKAQEKSQNDARALESRNQQESERRANDAAAKSAEDSQRNAKALQIQEQQDSQKRLNDAAVRTPEAPQRNTRVTDNPAPRVSAQPARERPAAGERGATRLLRNDRPNPGKGRPTQQEKPNGP